MIPQLPLSQDLRTVTSAPATGSRHWALGISSVRCMTLPALQGSGALAHALEACTVGALEDQVAVQGARDAQEEGLVSC